MEELDNIRKYREPGIDHEFTIIDTTTGIMIDGVEVSHKAFSEIAGIYTSSFGDTTYEKNGPEFFDTTPGKNIAKSILLHRIMEINGKKDNN